MRILSLGGLLLSLLVLSGCSLVPTQLKPVTKQNQDGTRDPFQVNTQPGAVWRSLDGGKTFEPKITVDEKRKITTADVLDISFLLRDASGDPRPQRAPSVFIGTVDNGIFRSDDNAETWQSRDFPPKKVYRFLSDFQNIDRMYATGVVEKYGKLFRSKDGGTTWQDVYTEPGPGTVITSLAQSKRNPDLLFMGTSAGTVVRSLDGGDTWQNIGTVIDGAITEIVFDALIPERVYALVFQKTVYRSDDSGLTWFDPLKQANNGRVTGTASGTNSKKVIPTQIQSLIADPSVSETLYVGTAKGLFRSTDGGKEWEKLNIIESAEKFPIRAMAIHPKDSREIVFIAGRTFYKSTNSGETWSVIPLDIDRDASVLSYDPFDPTVLYIGLRKFK